MTIATLAAEIRNARAVYGVDNARAYAEDYAGDFNMTVEAMESALRALVDGAKVDLIQSPKGPSPVLVCRPVQLCYSESAEDFNNRMKAENPGRYITAGWNI